MRGHTGFRTPGGTAREQIQVQVETAHVPALREARKLIAMIGEDNYRLWSEITWPGESINLCTWDEIYQQVHEAIWLGKYALLSELECTCKPDGDLCKDCRAWARVVA
jgi:hypothetical protein